MIDLKFVTGCLLLLIASGGQAVGQDSTEWSLQGYVKGMYTMTESTEFDELMHTGLLHARLRLDFNPSDRVSFRVDVRNRLYQGDVVRQVPGYVELMEEDPGLFDFNLSESWGADGIYVMNIDRLLVDYKMEQWRLTLGRQRINWGLNTVWNPHDIFNAYDYFDFDYEERPGADAVRMQYNWGGMSGLEVATSMDANQRLRGAFLYRFNHRAYDVQVLAGYSNHRWLTGFGWAGSLGETGFKGETRYARPVKDAPFENCVVATMGLDRTFAPGWYVGVNGLYTGSDSRIGTESPLLSFSYNRAVMVQVNRQINPVWNAGASIFYASENRLAIMPSVTKSLGQNWELMLTGIGFYEKQMSQNNLFLRLRWSFSS